MVQETGVQLQVESYQRLKKWYLIPPCLTLSTIRKGSSVNLGVVTIEKGAFGSSSTKVTNFTLLTMNISVYYESFLKVLVNLLNSDIVVSEFELKSGYYVHFRVNRLKKGRKPLIPFTIFGLVPYLSKKLNKLLQLILFSHTFTRFRVFICNSNNITSVICLHIFKQI